MDKLLATLKWSDTEELRVGLSEYRGKTYFGVRIWYSADGEMRPGKQGINIPVERIADFDEAMQKGLASAMVTLKQEKKGGAK